MTNFTMNSVKVAARLKVTDETEVDSTSATDALHILFEETSNNNTWLSDTGDVAERRDVNITDSCAYDWREPYVEVEYNSLAEANAQSAADFDSLATRIRELYIEREVCRKETEALQKIYDGLDQIQCDIANGVDKRHNTDEIGLAMGTLQTKLDDLAPLHAAW